MANDAGRAITFRRSFKAPSLQTERTKIEGPSEKNELERITVWNFQSKKPKAPVIVWKTKQKNHKTPGKKLNMKQVARKKLTDAKLKEAFRI